MGNKLILLPFFFLCFVSFTDAQCPPNDDPDIHVVQKGETFYGISRMYALSLEELYALNGLNENAILKICQELKVKKNSKPTPQPSTTTEPSPKTASAIKIEVDTVKNRKEKQASSPTPAINENAKSFGEYIRQKGKTHIVQPGEKLALIARLYGYTEEFFRDFNQIGPSETVVPGRELKSTHCDCPTDDIPDFNEGEPDLPVPEPSPDTTPENKEKKAPAPEAQSLQEPTINEKEQDQIDLPEPEAPTEEELPEGGLVIEDAPKTTEKEEKEVMEAPKPVLRQLEDSRPRPKAKDRTEEDSMQESALVIEINNLRTNPVGYADILSKHLDRVEASLDNKTLSEARELVTKLKSMGPLQPLRPNDCLFTVAKHHGLDEQQRGFAEHIGSDGSWPWDRVTNKCPELRDGSENLLAEKVDPREAVLHMLVDEGNVYRPNRKNLLRPDWKLIGVFKVGEVGGVPDNWVITFGK